MQDWVIFSISYRRFVFVLIAMRNWVNQIIRRIGLSILQQKTCRALFSIQSSGLWIRTRNQLLWRRRSTFWTSDNFGLRTMMVDRNCRTSLIWCQTWTATAQIVQVCCWGSSSGWFSPEKILFLDFGIFEHFWVIFGDI